MLYTQVPELSPTGYPIVTLSPTSMHRFTPRQPHTPPNLFTSLTSLDMDTLEPLHIPDYVPVHPVTPVRKSRRKPKVPKRSPFYSSLSNVLKGESLHSDREDLSGKSDKRKRQPFCKKDQVFVRVNTKINKQMSCDVSICVDVNCHN